jgi:hypothetical protein
MVKMTDQTPVKRGRGRPRKVHVQNASERSNLREANFAPRNITQGWDSRFEPFKRGWNDAIAGLPIDYKYSDNLPKWDAIAYENGRLKAFSVMSHGIKPPVWESSDRIPPKVTGAVNLAYSKTHWATRARGERVICDWPLSDESKWLPPNPAWNVDGGSSMPSVY